jgi:hypothetical protein
VSHSDWLQTQILQRRNLCHSVAGGTNFSVLTTVYERTNSDLFLQTRDSLFNQTHPDWEWIVLAHGPIKDRLDAILDTLSQDQRCHVLRLSENRGPMGGLRYCLEQARGEYITPLDADDLITPDALAVLNSYIAARGGPAYLFSDEDHLFGDTFCHPWLRPDLDPVLLMASSYIWHIAVFRRDIALTLGIYEDLAAEWCHDWDTALRFARSGHPCVHVPHILYHWRHHESSSTNTARPERGSLQSQRSVLERQLSLQSQPELFEVNEFPLFRGATEYAIIRRAQSPADLEIVVYGSHPTAAADSAAAAIRTANHPVSRLHIVGAHLAAGDLNRLRDLGSGDVLEHGAITPQECLRRLIASAGTWVAVCSERVVCNLRQWAWACDGLFRLHPEVVAVASRIVDSSGDIMSAGEIFGFDGLIGSPDAYRPASDPGYFALGLKPHCCSAPYSELMAVRTDFLSEFAGALPTGVGWPSVGLWIGAEAWRRRKLIAYTPLFSGVAMHESAGDRFRPLAEEARLFSNNYSTMVPDTRWYSRHHRWIRGGGYQLRTEDAPEDKTQAAGRIDILGPRRTGRL